jgi:uncharacterized protein (DUF2147 family)
MVRLIILVVVFLGSLQAQASDTLTGLWLTRDHDGIIKVSPCDGGLCAEIAGVILDHPTDPTPVDYRGVSQCHLQLISDAKPIRPNLWKDQHRNLALRGFIGIPLLGETQTWTRYNGRVPDDCRLLTSTGVAAPSRTAPPGPGRAQ